MRRMSWTSWSWSSVGQLGAERMSSLLTGPNLRAAAHRHLRLSRTGIEEAGLEKAG